MAESRSRIMPDRGVNYGSPNLLTDPRFAADVLNMIFERGRIRKRPGSSAYANSEASYPVLGLYELQSSQDLSKRLLKLTNLDIKSVEANGTWTKRTPRYITGTVTVTNNLGTVTGAGTAWDANNCRAGDRFYTTDGNGANTEYRIVSRAGATSITIEPVWAGTTQAGRAYQIDNLFSPGLTAGQAVNPTLGGDTHKLLSAVPFSDTGANTRAYNDYLVFSSGDLLDGIMSWRITDAVAAKVNTAYAARFLTAFAGRIVLGYTHETVVGSSTKVPQRVRWCVYDDHQNWSGTGSGFQDLADTQDEITGLRPLGNLLVAYKKKSIYFGIETLLISPAIKLEIRHRNRGMAAPFSLADFGDFHIFLSDDGIYRITQSSLDRIDTEQDIFRDIERSINYKRIEKCFGMADTKSGIYYLAIPTSASDFNNRVYVYRIHENTWTKYDLRINASTMYKGGSARTWDQATGSWDSQAGRWDEASPQDAPIVVFGDQSGNCRRIDHNSYSDAGSAINCLVQPSSDFLVDGNQGREIDKTVNRLVLTLEFKATIDITVLVSFNGGTTWSLALNKNITGFAPKEIIEAYFDFVGTGRHITYQFINNSTDQALDIIEYRTEFLPRGKTRPKA